MVVTMLAAHVPPDRAEDLLRAYGEGTDELPPFIERTFLLQEAERDEWRIVTVWPSRRALETYRASVETPTGVRLFRAVGVEPTLTVFEVHDHADRG